MCCLLPELVLVQVLVLLPVLELEPLLPEPVLLQVQALLSEPVLPRRNAESGCIHLLFQVLLHTVFR